MSELECLQLWDWLQHQRHVYLLHCLRTRTQVLDRIPGACDFVLEDVSSLQDLVTCLGRLGVRKDDSWVVCYEATGLEVASEAWWLLRSLGRENTAVLIGGLQEWRRLKLPTTPRAYHPSPISDPGYTTLPPSYRLEAELQGCQIIDTLGSYPGAIAFEPHQGLRQGRLENTEVLKTMLEQCGVDMSAERAIAVVGPQASLVLLQLAHAGKRNLCVGVVERSNMDLSPDELYAPSIVNEPPAQMLSVMDTVSYDARHSRFHSNALSLRSDMSRPSVRPHVFGPAKSQPKVGKSDCCLHCALQ